MRIMPKFKSILAGALIVAVTIAIAGYLFSANYVFFCGGVHRRDSRELVLHGATPSRLHTADRFTDLQLLDMRGTKLSYEDYQELTRLLPDCRILWDIPFQGDYLPQDTQMLTFSQLTAEEVALLDHLPDLKYIDARGCQEYDLLLQLQLQHPDCDIDFDVTICGQEQNCHQRELVLENATAEELSRKLPCFPWLQKLLLTGTLPELEDLQQLQNRFPLVHISWETQLGSTTISSDITQLDLRDSRLESQQQLAEALARYPALTQADLRGCGLSNEDIQALTGKFPHITFLWEVTVAGIPFSSDSEEIDISGQLVEDVAQIEALLPYFPNLKKVVMCDCGIDSETMDALNSRYEDIRFVWSVQLGDMSLRTDATYFMPIKYGVQVNTQDLKDLRYCTDIQCVDIGHMPVANCEWAAYMPNLKYLIIAETQITDITPLKDLKNLVYLELFLTGVTDISPLRGCTSLVDLNMCFVPCIDYKPLFEMTWLENLWWGGWLMRTYEAEFREALPNTRLCHDSASSTGGGWRELDNYFAMRDLLGMWYMTN